MSGSVTSTRPPEFRCLTSVAPTRNRHERQCEAWQRTPRRAHQFLAKVFRGSDGVETVNLPAPRAPNAHGRLAWRRSDRRWRRPAARWRRAYSAISGPVSPAHHAVQRRTRPFRARMSSTRFRIVDGGKYERGLAATLSRRGRTVGSSPVRALPRPSSDRVRHHRYPGRAVATVRAPVGRRGHRLEPYCTTPCLVAIAGDRDDGKAMAGCFALSRASGRSDRTCVAADAFVRMHRLNETHLSLRASVEGQAGTRPPSWSSHIGLLRSGG